MMTRKAFSFALPMVLLAAACSDNSDTAPDPDATMTVEPDGGIGDGAGPPEQAASSTASGKAAGNSMRFIVSLPSSPGAALTPSWG